MPGRLAALPGDGGVARGFLDQERRPLRRRRPRSGRLQPAPRLDSLDAGRALPLHAGRGLAAAARPRASWRARTGSSTRPSAPPTATSWSAACCPPAASRTSATGGPWLSTSCYTWRGLDTAAWALEQINHPEAPRVRQGGRCLSRAICWRTSARPPTARPWCVCATAPPCRTSLRWCTGAGRYFGWICETLEGSLHLLITGALDSRSQEADWIIKDYEDNRYLSNQYGYMLDDFDKYWFGRGGMSMQACLLLDVEPYLYRDDVKQALRALFNAEAAQYFPDERMNTEHALPALGDWRGDQYKSSDESNVAGWLRYLFVREEGDTLLVGQAVPREWLRARPAVRHRAHRDLLWPGKRRLHRWRQSNHRHSSTPRAATRRRRFASAFASPAAVRCLPSRSTASPGRSSKASGCSCRATSAQRPWWRGTPGSSRRCSVESQH